MRSGAAILFGCVAIAGGLCGGCASGRPIHYYAIDHPSLTAPSGVRPNGFILLVGRISTPEALDDGRIRYRTGTNEVGSYEYQRWTERPGIMVRDLLVETLRASGKYRQVQASSNGPAGDYLIRGKLYEFAEVDRPELHSTVSLQLELVDRKTGFVVWDHRFDRNEPVQGKKIDEVVQSLGRNLQQVIVAAAAGIDTFLAGAKRS